MGVICRVKKYELGNVVVSIPKEGDKTFFITQESRDAAQENFPPGSPVLVVLGNTKTTKGTVIRMEKLPPDDNAILIGQEIEANKTVIKDTKKPTEPAFTHAVLPKKDAPTDYKQFNVTGKEIREMAEKKCGVVPDVNVSCRDALIAQQSCLNRAVEIFEIEYPIGAPEGTEIVDVVDDIIRLKDRLFTDVWEKAGMTMKEKKE